MAPPLVAPATASSSSPTSCNDPPPGLLCSAAMVATPRLDGPRACTELGVDPEQFEALVAVGHRDEPGSLPEPLRAREVPSGRNPRASFVFHGALKHFHPGISRAGRVPEGPRIHG